MALLPPFNLNQWIEDNRALLKPPVGNKNIYPLADDYIVMVVAGPNARKDFHYNETEELFYQLEGTAVITIQHEGEKKEMVLNAGDMFLLPAKVPHSPARMENSIGLVIERVRAGRGFTDGLLWFCGNCNSKLHEAYFELNDIEQDFLPHFKTFYKDEHLRTCKNCGETLPVDSRYVAKED